MTPLLLRILSGFGWHLFCSAQLENSGAYITATCTFDPLLAQDIPTLPGVVATDWDCKLNRSSNTGRVVRREGSRCGPTTNTGAIGGQKVACSWAGDEGVAPVPRSSLVQK